MRTFDRKKGRFGIGKNRYKLIMFQLLMTFMKMKNTPRIFRKFEKFDRLKLRNFII